MTRSGTAAWNHVRWMLNIGSCLLLQRCVYGLLPVQTLFLHGARPIDTGITVLLVWRNSFEHLQPKT